MKIEDYSEYYIQGSDHYLIPKDVFKELFNEINNWKEENKQLKEIIQKATDYANSNLDYIDDNYISLLLDILQGLGDDNNE